MKKLLFFLAALLIAISASAEVSKVYVNPLQNSSTVDDLTAKRLYKKALLGLTKAKTIAISSGANKLSPASDEAQAYDYILSFTLTNATVEEAASVGNILGALSNSKTKEPDWEGKLTTEIIIADAKNGKEIFKRTLTPKSTNKDKYLALFNATNHFDSDVTDMTDDAFRVFGEVVEATEVNKKNIVKQVRVKVGSKDGARKNQAFELYKAVGKDRELIGSAKCEQVLNADESILSINGKNDGDKILSDLIQNSDGSYVIEAWSRSKSGLIHDNFQSLDKLFTNEGRLHYLDPFNRSAKPRVAFLAIEINDGRFSAQKNNFQNQVLYGMQKVPTVQLVRNIYSNIDDARKDGIDGLIEITVDKVFNNTEYTKEGKPVYKTDILYTLSGVDVAGNRWIDMKSYKDQGTSYENASSADVAALTLVGNHIQKFSEDVFPVAASIISPEEVKNNSVKKVRINAGTAMGLKKGMTFDIFEQRAEGGDDSRFLLGEGKVEKDGLSANNAVLKVKGKNNGDEKLYDLLQNMDENSSLVLISKASYNLLEKGANFLGRNK